MSEVLDIFKTTIFKTKIDINLYKDYFLNILRDYKKFNYGNEVSNIGGFQTNSINYINDKDILNNIFLNPTKEYIKTLNPKKEFNINLYTFWINSNNKNDYNLMHNHIESNISGVFYIKAPKSSGRLVFQNADLTRLNDSNFDFFDNPNFYSRYFCNVEEGDLYLFTSQTLHYVEANRSEEERISVAFNINIT